MYGTMALYAWLRWKELDIGLDTQLVLTFCGFFEFLLYFFPVMKLTGVI